MSADETLFDASYHATQCRDWMYLAVSCERTNLALATPSNSRRLAGYVLQFVREAAKHATYAKQERQLAELENQIALASGDYRDCADECGGEPDMPWLQCA